MAISINSSSGIRLNGSRASTQLQEMLMCDDIVPGASPSYQICKTIYSYHPLGKKMTDTPIGMAQSQMREISVAESPEDDVRDQFLREWKACGADNHIYNVSRLARIYGVSAIAMLIKDVPETEPPDWEKLWQQSISFNVYDALNIAGSQVNNQDPNAMDFQKTTTIAVNGKPYNRARACLLMNEDPLYIEYTTSGFGYVGRSVYQRALFPLKTFVQSMITDDMITRKAGLLIAMMKTAGSIVDNLMAKVAGVKRNLLKEGETDNVLSIGADESIESLDMQNSEGPATMARQNALDNIATSADMPATILKSETLAEGFGEGSEDAKREAAFVDGIRVWMGPVYDWFDKIVMYRAWNPEFYKTIQAKFPEEYGDMQYTDAFMRWRNSFVAAWPSLLREPESEQIAVEDVKLRSLVAAFEVLFPALDPENKATLIDWFCQNFNDQKILFQSPLLLDMEALKKYVPPEPTAPQEPGAPRPFADSAASRSLDGALQRMKDATTKPTATVQ